MWMHIVSLWLGICDGQGTSYEHILEIKIILKGHVELQYVNVFWFDVGTWQVVELQIHCFAKQS